MCVPKTKIKILTIFFILLIITFNNADTKAEEETKILGPYDEIENIKITNDGIFYTFEKNDNTYYQINNQTFEANGYCLPNADGCFPVNQFKTSDNNWMCLRNTHLAVLVN